MVTDITDIGFLRRKNPDSTTDLICLRCFMTVRSGNDETGFAALEMSHCCDPLYVRFPLDAEDQMSLKIYLDEHVNRREASSR
jgi:hypothetical protein